MSSNGRRKETRAWDSGPTQKLIEISTDDVPLEELPPSGPIVVSAAGAPPPAPRAAVAPMEQARARKDSDALTALDRPRARKSTLDSFNDEMSLLDRPLENDIEYVDEAPQPSRMRAVALFAGIVLGMGIGGGVILSRRHAAAPASAPQAAAAAPTLAAATPAAATPVLAAQAPAAVAVAPPPPEVADAPAADDGDSEADDDGAAAAAPSRGAWDKVKAKAGGHSKHSRSASGKSAHHRSSKRTVAAKHSSSRHH